MENNSEKAFIKPTESELEILHILWQQGSASVREVHTVLEKIKNCGYTTTLKLMQIMFEKGLLQRDETTRSHVYTAALPQKVAQKHYMQKMLDTFYAGDTSQLVLQVLGDAKVSKEEISKIEKFLKTIK
jgi:predicted transcriptional regulator